MRIETTLNGSNQSYGSRFCYKTIGHCHCKLKRNISLAFQQFSSFCTCNLDEILDEF